MSDNEPRALADLARALTPEEQENLTMSYLGIGTDETGGMQREDRQVGETAYFIRSWPEDGANGDVTIMRRRPDGSMSHSSWIYAADREAVAKALWQAPPSPDAGAFADAVDALIDSCFSHDAAEQDRYRERRAALLAFAPSGVRITPNMHCFEPKLADQLITIAKHAIDAWDDPLRESDSKLWKYIDSLKTDDLLLIDIIADQQVIDNGGAHE